MSDCCKACNGSFPTDLHKGSYQRISVKALSSPHTFHKAFPEVTAELNVNANQQIEGFLCGPCVTKLKSQTVQVKGRNGRKPIKRKWAGSPQKSSSKRTPIYKPSSHPAYSPTKGSQAYTPSKRLPAYTPSKRPPPYTPSKRPPPYTPSKRPPVSHKTPSKGTQFMDCSPYKRSSSLLQTPSKDKEEALRDLPCISPRVARSTAKKRVPVEYGPGPGFTYDASVLLRKHDYVKSFRLLAEASDNAKNALLKVVSDMLKNEKRDIKKSDTAFGKALTLESINEFNWTEAIDEMEEVAPVTVSVMKDLFPAAKNIRGYRTVGSKKDKRAQTLAEAETTLATRVGTAMSLVLFANNPKKFKFVPSAIGVELWRQGTTHKSFVTLNMMGVSLSSSAARGHVDRLRTHHDAEIVEWKSIVQQRESGQNGCRKKSAKISLEKKLSNSLGPNCSYGVCWDNVQIEAHAKHQGNEKKNQFLLWGMMFGVNNRVPSLNLKKDDTIPAVDVPISAFIPTVTEMDGLRQHLEHIVVQVLRRNLDCVEHLHFPKHRRHAHTNEMNTKTNVVNLGVKEANPSTTDGCITIMQHLYRHVPVVGDKAIPILCSGDGMTFERMVHAHLGRSNGRTHEHRLDGLVEAPQEFHKEILLLQDQMNLLFRGNSLAARGTLAQLKAEFKHRSLQKEVKNNVAEVWDMVQFSTEAYVTLCAMKLRGMSSIDSLPDSFPYQGSIMEQKSWVLSLAAEVVDFCWLAPPDEDTEAIRIGIEKNKDAKIGDEVFPYCCREGKDEDMVRCCSWQCDRVWHHLSCANLQEAPEEDWYCSPECLAASGYVYCNCHSYTGGQMLECALGAKCQRHQWYHVKCVDVPEGVEGTWYCSQDCSLGALQDDPVLNHSKAIMWAGLNNMARREAVRDGNGLEMLVHWKLDLPKFWSYSHPKYFIIAHHFLAMVAGVSPEHIREDLIWNRVGNLKGNESGNVGLDLINEFLNNDFKELLKNSHGRYTAKQVARCAEMGGAFGRQMDRLFTLAGLGQYDSRSTYHKSDHYKEDIRTFCHDYMEDALFDYLPGRQPEGFENFTCDKQIRSPLKMGQKIHDLCALMDFRKTAGRVRREEN